MRERELRAEVRRAIVDAGRTAMLADAEFGAGHAHVVVGVCSGMVIIHREEQPAALDADIPAAQDRLRVGPARRAEVRDWCACAPRPPDRGVLVIVFMLVVRILVVVPGECATALELF
jgi:hypothetical protein